MEDFVVVGKRVTRIDAMEKVTGSAIYGTDLKLPGMLYGKVLRSPLSHARILCVDTHRAERLPGVRAVATGKDLRATYGRCIQDQPYYCFDKVRYIGDPVAGVAAVDEDTAEEALDLIQVEYEELPAVLDPLEAMNPGCPLVHEDVGEYWHGPAYSPIKGTNICEHFRLRKGNTGEGFEDADYISEETFTTSMVQHCHLEPHVAVVQVDASGRVLVWCSTQGPYGIRGELARSLGLPSNKIRVMVTHVGGAFGGKTGLKVEPLCYVLASKVKNNRPVKIVLTREEEFYGTSVVRHPSIITVRSGVRRDGTLTAHRIRIIFDTGAYADSGPLVVRSCSMGSNGPYNIQNIDIDGYCVYTNKTIAGSFRGFGVSQVTWAVESQMDILAEMVGFDPVEFRLKNALDEGSISAAGQVLKGVGIKECVRKAADAITWRERGGGRARGKGIAAMHKSTQTPTSSSAFIKLNEGGTAEILMSAVEMGQGSNTALVQIAAEELGLDPQDVRIVSPDTDVTPYDQFTGSSRSTFHIGNAVKIAAQDAKRQLLETAAHLLEANPLDLESQQGTIYVKGSPDRRLLVKQIPMGGGGHFSKGKPIIGRGTFTSQDGTSEALETSQGLAPSVFWIYGAQAAEVEVDQETGMVKVLKVTSAHDVGKAINPLTCEQQIEGAIGTGVSTTLMEEIKLEKGKTLNPNFTDYKIATSLDMPEMVPLLVETIHEQGPYGAKGIGEPALAPTAPAIANAIYDAVGVRIKDLPITPDKVLKALKEKR